MRNGANGEGELDVLAMEPIDLRVKVCERKVKGRGLGI